MKGRWLDHNDDYVRATDDSLLTLLVYDGVILTKGITVCSYALMRARSLSLTRARARAAHLSPTSPSPNRLVRVGGNGDSRLC